MSKKAPTFREEMNCQRKSLSIQAISKSVPTGSGEFTPDKPIKKSLRWNKTSGLEGHDGGTVDEAGTSNPSGMRGCQSGWGMGPLNGFLVTGIWTGAGTLIEHLMLNASLPLYFKKLSSIKWSTL